MLARLRPLYNMIFAPLGVLSHKLGLSANFWTLFGLLLSFISAYLLSRQAYWGGLALGVAMFLSDAMDGATARASGTVSKFGMLFDHVTDRYAEFILVGGLLLGGGISQFTAILITSGMIMASYVRAKAESTGLVADCTVGLAGRAEKLILIFIGIGCLGIGQPTIAEYIFIAVGVISHITAIQRLRYSWLQSRLTS